MMSQPRGNPRRASAWSLTVRSALALSMTLLLACGDTSTEGHDAAGAPDVASVLPDGGGDAVSPSPDAPPGDLAAPDTAAVDAPPGDAPRDLAVPDLVAA